MQQSALMMQILRCPICGAELGGNILQTDILSAHWRKGDCSFNYQQETLDLYHFFLTDALLLINTLLRLPNVRHVYLKIPNKQKNYYLTYLRTSQEISQLTTFEPSFFDNLLIRFGFYQNLSNILPFLYFQGEVATLLQIPFETLRNTGKSAFLHSGKVTITDLGEICKQAGIYFSDSQLRFSFLHHFYDLAKCETTRLNSSQSACKVGADDQIARENIYRHARYVSASSSTASAYTARMRLDEEEAAAQKKPVSTFLQTINAIQKLLQINAPSSYNLEYVLRDYLPQAVKRRADSIFCKYDVLSMISALVPHIETVDGVRVLPRKEAQAQCLLVFSFPHKQMFPTKKIPVQRGVVGTILESVGIFNKRVNSKIIAANDLSADMLRGAVVCPEAVEFALRHKNYLLVREVDMTQKALAIYAVYNPRIYSVSACLVHGDIAAYNTGNFPTYTADFSLRGYGRLTSIAACGDTLLIGNEKGAIFRVNSLLTACEQEAIGIQTFDFPAYSTYNAINNIVTRNQRIVFTTETGYYFDGATLTNMGAPIHYLDCGERGLVSTSIGVFSSGKLLYPDAICAYSDKHIDYVGYGDGRVDLIANGLTGCSLAVSTMPIVYIMARGDILIIADAAAQLFAFRISTHAKVGQLLQSILHYSTFSLGFLGHRVVLGQRGLIRICESDLKVFREVFIDEQIEMTQFCQVDSGSFAVLVHSGAESEVIIIDLLRDSYV